MPPCEGGAATLVKDAIQLHDDTSTRTAVRLICHYSGRNPAFEAEVYRSLADRRPETPPRTIKQRNRLESPAGGRLSPSRLSARFLSQQKGLESLFQEVSGEVQRRTEGWSISRAVQGAVGEVRRNVNNFQAAGTPAKISEDKPEKKVEEQNPDFGAIRSLTARVQELEDRNKILADMLGSALDALRKQNERAIDTKQDIENDEFNTSLAKIQFVQVYLADPEIPIPPDGSGDTSNAPANLKNDHTGSESDPFQDSWQDTGSGDIPSSKVYTNPEAGPDINLPQSIEPGGHSTEGSLVVPAVKHRQRPSLANSSFSFILGETRHWSSFVSSATSPPEHRRDGDPRSGRNQSMPASRVSQTRGKQEGRDDSFTMSGLRSMEKGSS